jgi:hypothetical protein
MVSVGMTSGRVVSTGGSGGPPLTSSCTGGRWVEQGACAWGLLDDDICLDRFPRVQAGGSAEIQISKESLCLSDVGSDDIRELGHGRLPWGGRG